MLVKPFTLFKLFAYSVMVSNNFGVKELAVKKTMWNHVLVILTNFSQMP